MVIWTNSVPLSDYALFSAITLDGQNWQAFTLIQGGLYSLDADLAADTIGDAYCVFMAQDLGDNNVKIYCTASHIGSFGAGSWTSPVLFRRAPAKMAIQELARLLPALQELLPDELVDFRWFKYPRPGKYRNRQHCPTSFGVSASQSSNSFGIFQEYYNTLTWSASSDPNLSNYTVYRNGVLLTTLSSSQLSFVDDNQTQSGTVVYWKTRRPTLMDTKAPLYPTQYSLNSLNKNHLPAWGGGFLFHVKKNPRAIYRRYIQFQWLPYLEDQPLQPHSLQEDWKERKLHRHDPFGCNHEYPSNKQQPDKYYSCDTH